MKTSDTFRRLLQRASMKVEEDVGWQMEEEGSEMSFIPVLFNDLSNGRKDIWVWDCLVLTELWEALNNVI